jgi:hypothetical protein
MSASIMHCRFTEMSPGTRERAPAGCIEATTPSDKSTPAGAAACRTVIRRVAPWDQPETWP